MQRREFLRGSLAASTACLAPAVHCFGDHHGGHDSLPYKISLAQWSLHRALRDPKSDMSNLDFPKVAKEEFGIDAIEYVNQFFMDKAEDEAYLAKLKGRCEDHGVTSLLIMVDREGDLGDANEAKRQQAVDNHRKWLSAAQELGCHSIRVNARSTGSFEEQQQRAADGLRRLSEIAAPMNLNVIVENHGGLSSNGQWLAGTIEKVGLDNCGTLPDFGNFYIKRGDDPELYDRYQGVRELMPYAKAVSAKSHAFDDQGNETETDYTKMMQIVLDHDYHGHVGIEYEGNTLDEFAGIKATRDLLIKVGQQLANA